MTKILAWHFLPETRLMLDGYGPVEPGYVYTYHGKIALCKSGLHASVDPLDAAEYAPGPIVCRVQCSGEMDHSSDKLSCRHREVIWMADATNTLHLYACDVAESAMRRANVRDPRCWAAIDAKRRWVAGDIGDSELNAALAASRVAAWAAARAAALAASKNAAGAASLAASWAASGAASWAASGAASGAASLAASWAAARNASLAAARNAAWAAAKAELSKLLARRLNALAPDDYIED